MGIEFKYTPGDSLYQSDYDNPMGIEFKYTPVDSQCINLTMII